MTLNGGTWVYVTDGYISDTYTGMALKDVYKRQPL